ncbi:MAG: hypothetical protein GWN17_15895, partial [Candidatus Korarchaeota archaeon]|nr:hypothetical protein [Candidatus Korarchaeota archaeon]
MFSQGEEENVVLDYFGKYKGHLVDIGANDGETFSNSRQLILNGWSADLYEPGPAFEKLEKLYKGNELVELHNVAIGSESGKGTLNVNSSHIKDDVGLLSTLHPEEMKRWQGLEYTQQEVDII